jgi:hypothetical protein
VDLPPSPVEFPSLRPLTSFPAPGCWAHAPAPHCHRSLSGQSQLIYLQFQEGFPSPPLRRSGCPTLFARCLNCSYCLLLSFSFFPPGGVRSVQGAMLIWPRFVCGSTASRLAHLVRVFPRCLGAGDWRPRGLFSWFLCLT